MNNPTIVKKVIASLGVIMLGLILMMPGGQRVFPAEFKKAPQKKTISEYDFPGLEKKIAVDLRDMDIVDVLKFLAIEGDLNIVAGKDVTGPVNLLINNVTVGDALEIVLSINNFAYEVRGNVIKIITNKEYKSLYGVDFYDQRKTVVYQLRYASAKNLAALLGNVKSDIGKIIYDDTTATLVLIDTPAKIKEMEEIVMRSELPTVTRVLPTKTKVFELQYAKVDDIKEEIAAVLTEDIGSMRIDKRTNSIVITDLPHQFERIETVIEAFDRKSREVFIEAKVVEVTLADAFQWGVDWENLFKYGWEQESAERGVHIKPESNLPLGLSGEYGKLTISSVENDELSFVLEFLRTLTETKIISNPHLTVEEGKEAMIQVVERQPYEEETTTQAGETQTTAKSFKFVDVGVLLNVIPTINQQGYITINIRPEVSSISEWYGGAPQTSGAVPVVKTANAQTTVTVKDGVTVIIAGLIKDNKAKTIHKVPLLGDVPLLGSMFRSTSNEVKRTETIIFLTPRIVSGEKPFLFPEDFTKKIKGIRK